MFCIVDGMLLVFDGYQSEPLRCDDFPGHRFFCSLGHSTFALGDDCATGLWW
jgi:hypothetical protein